MAGSLRDVTDATFAKEVIGNDKPVLVDFWAELCGPCRLVAPVLEELAAEYRDRTEVVQLDVDANPRTAAEYGVRSIPILNVFRGGKVVKTVIGAMPKTALDGSWQSSCSSARLPRSPHSASNAARPTPCGAPEDKPGRRHG